MKYNLKNKPKKESVTKGFVSDLECFYEYTLNWFEGFEKELKDKVKQLQKEAWNLQNNEPMRMNTRHSMMAILIEILDKPLEEIINEKS